MSKESRIELLLCVGALASMFAFCIFCGCDDPTARARERLATMEATEVAETPEPLADPVEPIEVVACECVEWGPEHCECMKAGYICQCSKPGNAIYSRFDSPCIIKLGATYCGPCKQNETTVDPWLRRSGWVLHSFDEQSDARLHFGMPYMDVWDAVQLDALPTYIIVRHGYEVGRYSGTSQAEFLPVLKRAVELRMPD